MRTGCWEEEDCTQDVCPEPRFAKKTLLIAHRMLSDSVLWTAKWGFW